MFPHEWDTTDIPVVILNVQDILAEYIVLYGWLRTLCQPMWVVNYKDLISVSGLTQKKISTGIAFLECKGLIFVEREKSKVKVEIAEIPTHIYQKYKNNILDIKLRADIQENHKKILKMLDV